MAVLLDVVYNHVGMDMAGQNGIESIWNFEQWDMHHDHESYLWSDQDHLGPCWDIDWKEPCRQYLIDNALFFLREYHIDGFRYDETTKIIENNRARGWEWCQNLTSTVRYVKPRAVQIAEHWPWGGPDPWVVGTEWDHAGFDVCYHDGLRRAIRDALRQASYGMNAPVDMGRIAEYSMAERFSASMAVPPTSREPRCRQNRRGRPDTATCRSKSHAHVVGSKPQSRCFGFTADSPGHSYAVHGTRVPGGQTMEGRSRELSKYSDMVAWFGFGRRSGNGELPSLHGRTHSSTA